jgi:hypothetical protein
MKTQRTWGLVAMAGSLLVGGCGVEQGEVEALATAASALADEARRPAPVPEDVQELVLRHVMAEQGRGFVEAYCVSVSTDEGDLEPGKELVGRLADVKPLVAPLSHCSIDVAGDIYLPTGGWAQWFKVGVPRFGPSGRTATLTAGYHLNGRSAEWYSCEARLKHGAWTLEGCTLTHAA